MTVILANSECEWMTRPKEIMKKYRIELEDVTGTKEQTKIEINQIISLEFREKSPKTGKKIQTGFFFLGGNVMWKPEDPAEYMTKLT